MRVLLLLALFVLPDNALAEVKVNDIVRLDDQTHVSITYRNDTLKSTGALYVKCEMIGEGGQKIGAGKALIRGPVKPGGVRPLTVITPVEGEKVIKANCQEEKKRITWVIWSFEIDLDTYRTARDRWTKFSEEYKSPSKCGKALNASYDKKIHEIKLEDPKAKRRGNAIIYRKQGKRWSYHFQCAQSTMKLGPLK